jgi:hypothetical protein
VADYAVSDRLVTRRHLIIFSPTENSYDRMRIRVTVLPLLLTYACGSYLPSAMVGQHLRQLMADPQCVAMCCYKSRDITRSRCAGCRPEYGCVGFRSSAELVHFNELIPPSMLGERLPLNLWPNLWKAIEPLAEPSGAAETTPVRLLVAALLECGKSAPQNPDR